MPRCHASLRESQRTRRADRGSPRRAGGGWPWSSCGDGCITHAFPYVTRHAPPRASEGCGVSLATTGHDLAVHLDEIGCREELTGSRENLALFAAQVRLEHRANPAC